MKDINLWEETIKILKQSNKTWDDVKYIIANAFDTDLKLNRDDPKDYGKMISISKDNFEDIARNYDYYNGYGLIEVPITLQIVGDNWWLERYEYDGSERWDFKTMPENNDNLVKIKRIDNQYDGRLITEV